MQAEGLRDERRRVLRAPRPRRRRRRRRRRGSRRRTRAWRWGGAVGGQPGLTCSRESYSRPPPQPCRCWLLVAIAPPVTDSTPCVVLAFVATERALPPRLRTAGVAAAPLVPLPRPPRSPPPPGRLQAAIREPSPVPFHRRSRTNIHYHTNTSTLRHKYTNTLTPLQAAIRERYAAESLWSDKIRRASSWWTAGLIGFNALTFLVRCDLRDRVGLVVFMCLIQCCTSCKSCGGPALFPGGGADCGAHAGRALPPPCGRGPSYRGAALC
jgi:hypothetical protein